MNGYLQAADFLDSVLVDCPADGNGMGVTDAYLALDSGGYPLEKFAALFAKCDCKHVVERHQLLKHQSSMYCITSRSDEALDSDRFM